MFLDLLKSCNFIINMFEEKKDMFIKVFIIYIEFVFFGINNFGYDLLLYLVFCLWEILVVLFLF